MLSDEIIAPVRWHGRARLTRSDTHRRHRRREAMERMAALLAADPVLAARLQRVAAYQRSLRVSEYHLTNACNIRCKGCWFFEGDFDKSTREEKDLGAIEAFVAREVNERKINMALVIGGEPTMFPKRLAVFAKHMRHMSISTNGLEKLPVEGFEDVAIGVTLFGGGPLDDELRAIKPGGRRFEGLFDKALDNYRDDRRVAFVFAVTEAGIGHIEPTVRRIRENGNAVIFNYYSDYSAADPLGQSPREELLHELLRVHANHPGTVVTHPYAIRTMVTGRSHWDTFGYDTCASVSRDFPGHAARLANGNPTLPFFNTYAADMKTIASCCTSGRCDSCRDGQAVNTWLLVNMDRFTGDLAQLRTWVEIAESWWAQFCWSPYHRTAVAQTGTGAAA